MRVTIDIDTKNRFSLVWRAIYGTLLLGRPPDVVRESSGGRGYHMIWRRLDISFKQSLRYRELLRDDPTRIKLDRECSRSCKQILFTKKTVEWREDKH